MCRQPIGSRDVTPEQFAELLGRPVHYLVCGAHRHRQHLSLAKDPLRGPADNPDESGAARRCCTTEMCIDDRGIDIGHASAPERDALRPPQARRGSGCRRGRAQSSRCRTAVPETRFASKCSARRRAPKWISAHPARASGRARDRQRFPRVPSRGTNGRHAAPPRPSVSARIRQNSLAKHARRPCSTRRRRAAPTTGGTGTAAGRAHRPP